MEQLLAQHKKETRDLVATTTGMRKQATKSTRKEVLKRIAQMEADLKIRHEKELRELNGEEPGEEQEVSPEQLLAQMSLAEEQKPVEAAVSAEPKKKRNRQKERLAKREAEFKKLQQEAESEASTQPNLKEMELNNIAQLCTVGRLVQQNITPDGHCLFASIADQLQERHGITVSVQQLRTQAANQIRNDPDTFAPFLFDEETMENRNVDEYTAKLENTVMWGGDLEILALAKEYDCPISVMMSGRAPMKINSDAQQPELKLVYYQHAFGLGEHYNSLRDMVS
ncbi:hypothetical protein OGAPHI_007320 [Ogataea philodendri]|uniref:OTU domain-containing protein n=1 Tax=Ogataea philodendri TaxID=1378263 RepID=A0A9P8NV52_9ASCO|nr:uncharacterized protein OGAPHI_007320 [Ogataea philodendri]KAH3660115.1 hypothetical protein OGAPHI_007320 [Ogataea philodendri]